MNDTNGSHATPSSGHRTARHSRPRAALWLLLCLLVSSCARQPIAPESATGGTRFGSAEAAVDALVASAIARDKAALLEIFGPDGFEVTSSGDEVADAQDLEAFVSRAAAGRRIVPLDASRAVLEIGNDGWPFAIPLRKGKGGWYFDTLAGKEELLNRRIGRNELSTIRTCLAYVEAQREYLLRASSARGPREYARRIHSTPGKRDGLYWESREGEEPSPLGPRFAEAEKEGYAAPADNEGPRPYHGYLFRILTAEAKGQPPVFRSYVRDGRMTGGFALVAYPAEYGVSGVATFIVNQVGVVFERDLGEQTAELGRGMTAFAPDDAWMPVVPPDPLD
jgi:hypothetical protein